MTPLIGYARVSTAQQGRSGLGLEAQQHAINTHRDRVEGKLYRTYVEVESGTKGDDERPQLAAAIQHARLAHATLVVARLDRLSRNVAFLSALMDSGLDFVCLDCPGATRLTIHVLVAVAEDEQRRISERTKAALQAYKARGGRLGSARDGGHRLTADAASVGRKLGTEATRRAAKEAYKSIVPFMLECRTAGMPFGDIARTLNEQGYKTRTGRPWGFSMTRAVILREGNGDPWEMAKAAGRVVEADLDDASKAAG